MKVLAARIGVSVGDYERLRQVGLKWCFKCNIWKSVQKFNKDASRYDGLMVYCRTHRLVLVPRPRRPAINPLTGRSGPAPFPCRDGDKMQARQKVALEVRMGRLPPAKTLPCADCGHVWKPGEPRHQYDHFNGYSAENHYAVQPVCVKCHAKRGDKARQTHCKLGHPFTAENTIRINGNGTRKCRECRRAYDRRRRDAGWWRAYRARRKEAQHGT
jgi:hypothetical protein